MKCPFCGNEIENDSRFCKYCGKRPVDPKPEVTDDSEESGKNGKEAKPDSMDQKPEESGENGSVDERYDREIEKYLRESSKNREAAEGGLGCDPQVRVKKGFGEAVRALASVLLFVALMFIMQSCVISAYTTSMLTGNSSYAAALLESEAGSDTWAGVINEITDKVNEKTVLILLVANLLTLLTLCLIFHVRHKNPLEEMSFYNMNPMRYFTFAVFGVSLNIFVSVTLSLIQIPDAIMTNFENHYSSFYISDTPYGIIVEVLSTAVVAAVVEEIIFRGIAMKRLVPAFGKPAAVVISALIFGIAHGTPVAIAYASLLGLILGMVYAVYNSIYPCIFIHVFFNFASYLIEGVPTIVVGGLYGVSMILIVYCSYRIFVRRPVWNDFCFDAQGVIPRINEKEDKIVGRLMLMQTGKIPFSPEEVTKLNEEWSRNRSEYKRNRRKAKNYGSNQSDKKESDDDIHQEKDNNK